MSAHRPPRRTKVTGCSSSASGTVFRDRKTTSVTDLMLNRIANIKLAIVVLICVLCLFFFPAARGSFSATHGPVTSGRSRLDERLLYCSLRLGIHFRGIQIKARMQRLLTAFTDSLALLELFPRALAFDLRC